MGKIIGGGLPVGAVGGRAEIMSAVFDPRAGKAKVGHGGTYNANPLTMAAGAAAMRLFDRPAFERLSALGARLREGLAEAVRISGAPAMVRGAASLAGIYQVCPKGEDYRALYAARAARPDAAQRTQAFFRHMLNHGVLMGASGIFVLSTAHTEADVDRVIEESLVALRSLDRLAA
jgi:glutamate-1-semialdehyde 2,1-aminomutase